MTKIEDIRLTPNQSRVFLSELRIYITMYYRLNNIKLTEERVKNDFLDQVTANELESTITGDCLFNTLQANEMHDYLEDKLRGLNKNAFYKIKNRIVKHLYILYGGKYELKEIA